MKTIVAVAANVLHAAVVGGLVLFVASQRIEADVAVLTASLHTEVTVGARAMSGRLDSLREDVTLLSRNAMAQAALTEPPDAAALEQLFSDYVAAHAAVDQVRWLDETGHERIRVQRGEHGPVLLPGDALQDKSQRYYFAESVHLPVGELYLSPLDLNVERGRVEVPHRPMIRGATPVAWGGRRRGVIVVNMLGANILAVAKAVEDVGRSSRVSILNDEGYWLVSPDPAEAFGFALEAPDATLARRQPALWQAMQAQTEGHLRVDGLWVWAGTAPMLRWKVASHVPEAELAEMRRSAVAPVAAAGGVMLLFAWLASAVLVARARQRRLLEESRRAHEREHERMATLLEAICEGSNDAIFATDLEGRITLSNAPYEGLSGADRGELGGTDEAEVLVDGETVRREVELRAARKTRIYDAVRHPLRDRDGRIFGMFGIARDITQLREREREHQDSEERLYLLLNSIAEGVCGIDTSGCCTFINSAGLEMLGYDWEEELLGKPFHELVHGRRPDGSAYPASECKALAALESWREVEVRDEVFWTRAGEALPVEYRAHTLTKAGEPRGVVITWIEVSQRRAAEARMRKLSLALEQSPDKIVITKTDGTIEYVNPAFERNTGYSKDEVIGRKVGLLRSGQTAPSVYADLRQALEARRPWRGEFVNQRKDGSTFIDRAHIAPLVSADGLVTHYVSVQEDVTERKHLDAELDRHRHHLQDLVDERTVQLEEARDKAERLARAKSEFLANMSHEIRTPLNAVLGLARIGARESAGRATANTYRRIQSAGEHLLGVINDILDFSKAEAGKLQCESYAFDLHQVLSAVMELVSQAARDKSLGLQLEQVDDLPRWVLGDEHRVRQILINLLSNAVKFTHEGQVRLHARRADGDLVFEVTDTGIGMDEEQLGRLFNAFEQADGSTTRRFGGTGLGLSISQRLARMMGGEITARSALGEGATFSLRLPLAAAPEPEASARVALTDTQANLHGLRILAADDLEDNRFILEDLLLHEGAEVEFATNGQEVLDALDRAGTHAFDLVLMDIQMPVMDGYHATAEVLRLAPNLPVIGLTAHALAEERDRCLRVGMRDHVTKPIDPQQLVEAILRVVGGSASVPSQAEAAAPEPEPAPQPPPEGSDVRAEPGPLIDGAALDARYGGRRAFIDKLVQMSLKTHRDTPQRLREAIEAGDSEAIQFLAHGLKGLGGNFEAQALHALAKQTEGAVKAGDDGVAALGCALACTLDAFLEELSGYGTQN